jgi:hypothetical protein
LGAPGGRHTKHIARAAALALGALALAFAASPARAATPFLTTGNGLTEPAGVAVTPDGAVWVSDALNGVCRVGDSRDEQTGSRLVHDQAGYCTGHVETEVPVGPDRPSAAFQIAFDAAGCDPATTDPADLTKCNFYVAEGSSAGSGVWRMHWNPATKVIDRATKIYFALGDNRVFGLALSPEGHVDFSSKRDNLIRRLENPATTDFFPIAKPAGFSQVEGAASLAHLGQALYLADGGALTRIDAPGDKAGQGGVASTVGGLPAGELVSALAANTAEGVVYAGTSSGKLVDSVLAATLADGVLAEPYDGLFANVTALAVTGDGTLYTAHDPTAALTPAAGTAGQAELFRKAPGPLNAPRVTLTATPQPVQRSGEPADVVFRFQSRAGASFDCTLDGQPVTCSDQDGDGQGEFSPATALAPGTHEFTVQAAAGTDAPGPKTTWAFVIDLTAPDVSIDDPAATAVGGSIRLRFSSSEPNVSFECALDGGELAPCSSPKDYSSLALGPHTFTVRATNAAGNASAFAAWDFTAVPAPARLSVPAPTSSGGAGTSSAAPPIRVPSTPRPPRLEIYVPCAEVSPGRERASFRLSGRHALVRFRAPAKARYAKFTLRRATTGRTRARIVETLAYARVARADRSYTTRIALTRGQRRKLRAGAMRIAIAYGTCRTQVGQWQWLASTTKEGSLR